MGTLVDAPTGAAGEADDAAGAEVPTGAGGSWAKPASGHAGDESLGGDDGYDGRPDLEGRAVVPFHDTSDIEGDVHVVEVERHEAIDEAEGVSLPVTPRDDPSPRGYPC